MGGAGLLGPNFLFIKLNGSDFLSPCRIYTHHLGMWSECARGSWGLHILMLLQYFLLYPSKSFW